MQMSCWDGKENIFRIYKKILTRELFQSRAKKITRTMIKNKIFYKKL